MNTKEIDKLLKEEFEELPKDPETLKRMRKAYLDFYKEESAKYKEKKPKPYTRKKIMGRTQIELATGGKIYSNPSRKPRI